MTIQTSREMLGKVPEISLWFWLIKIAATTLGETGGDAVTMKLKTAKSRRRAPIRGNDASA